MDLRNGDCLEVMKELDDDSVDLLFADLPYGQTSCKWDCLIDLDLFWKEVNRVCKLEAAMVFTCTTKFGVSLINSNPKNFRYDLVWVKSAPSGFLCARKQPMRKHEMVYFFYRKQPNIYNDNLSLHHKHKFKATNQVIKENNYDNAYSTEKRNKPIIRTSANQYDPKLPTSIIKEEVYETGCYQTADHSSSKNYDGYGKDNDFSIYQPPLPNTILEVKSQRGKHPTQKPVALMEWVIKYYTKEGDVVLDPCMGSGSTGEACKNLKRNFIGIEMNEEIFEVAFNRLIE